MELRLIKISSLKNNSGQIKGLPKNPRLLKGDKYKKLVESIKEDPEMLHLREVIAYDNDGELVVIAGNMRLKACKEAGLNEVPTKVLPSDTPVEKLKRYTIKDNNSFGEWSYDDLANEWDADELDAWGLDTPAEWSEPDEVVEDDAPEVEESQPPISKLGEVYQLGRHRIMCGSATDDSDVNTLMAGDKADMVFTDPPYGMNYSGRGKETSNTILGDDTDPTLFYNVGSDISERYIWGRVENYKHLNEEPRDTIIWRKNNFGMGSGYRGQYECCFYYGSFNGSDSDVWDVSKDTKYVHPTQKPVELAVRAIKNSKPKKIIDYFLGSGSTLIACEQTDRICYGMELDPKYIDVIRKRWAKYVYGDEVLEEDRWIELTPVVT